ncbi:ultraviolet-b receptor uvr8 [Phtheirospermum japonicum]|uniref:Ultraviolet-b receptor uvr8 n=1 Tax=Phtheirospermum japonicum TaxID=374723 RepID=A0A830BNS1_9LAMI|nr:ultraviolet-b receptor uvr8 [Phtheirospermum japonicum]
MADLQRPSLVDRDIDQAITALKKGAHLLKYGRRGKPKFCPFRLSNDESTLIWYYGKDEKQLELRHVSRIIPGQRTICKDKDEAEVWFVGLKALIARGNNRKLRKESRNENALPESPRGRRDQGVITQARSENSSQSRLGKAFADVLSYTATNKNPPQSQPDPISYPPPALQPNGPAETSNARTSGGGETIRVSLSSAVSSSSQGSCVDDFDNLGDVFIWGQGIGDGLLGGGLTRAHRSSLNAKIDALLPKALESTVVLDAHRIACGQKHAVLVTKQGEIFSWGEEENGRLGHGVDSDISHPKLIQTLSGKSIEMVACGEYHTCAVTISGDLYTWGDDGCLGGPGHWIPKRVRGPIEGLQVAFVSCGPWHTAVLTSAGRLFTFGDGTFGALGHGDRDGVNVPREVEDLKGLKTMKVACGVWHTAAVVEVGSDSEQPSDRVLTGKLFTWGDGDKGQLGHGDCKARLVPECVASVVDSDFSQVVCGSNLTVALTTSGRVYTMGSTSHGQQGSPSSDGKIPICVRGTIADSCVEEIACGSHHVAILTSKSEVYTWGRGSNGQLGHGDTEDRNIPTLVESLKDKQVRSIACGSSFTAVICLHKWISTADNSVCSGCHNPFNFMRKRHNCYNCGLVFCKTCSTRKSLKASLAPSANKPYRVCDDCFLKLQKLIESANNNIRISNVKSVNKMGEMTEKDGKGNISRLSSVESFKSDRNFVVKAEHVFEIANEPVWVVPEFSVIFCPGFEKVVEITVASAGKDATEVDNAVADYVSVVTDVENLTSKSQHLEAELERQRKQLKEVTARAADEAEKSKAAKEVIKSLTAQLKEMAEKVPDGQGHLDTNEQMANDPNRPSNGSSVTSITSPKSESSDNSNTPQLPNGTKPQLQKTKRIVQDEPGVYITLVTLPNGVNELRRVRFRKRFTEDQAEKWWAENGTRVCERHNVRTVQ